MSQYWVQNYGIVKSSLTCGPFDMSFGPSLQYAIWSEAMADFRPSAISKKGGGGGGLKPCKAVATTGNGFANATSIHGISYIFDNSLLVLERVLWFVVVAVFVGLCTHFIVDAYLDWQRNPIITSVSSTGIQMKTYGR